MVFSSADWGVDCALAGGGDSEQSGVKSAGFSVQAQGSLCGQTGVCVSQVSCALQPRCVIWELKFSKEPLCWVYYLHESNTLEPFEEVKESWKDLNRHVHSSGNCQSCYYRKSIDI